MIQMTRLRRRLARGASPLLCLLLLAGCASSDMSDLEDRVEEIKSRPPGRLKPLPAIKPYQAYTYQSSKDTVGYPFSVYFALQAVGITGAQGEEVEMLRPEWEMEIKNRNKEELEQFQLDSLRMVGFMENEEELWGVVKDSGGVVYRVVVGNYMGKNFGKIIEITENKIVLREIVRGTDNRWDERQAQLLLEE